jgi:hypothetical protein
MTCASATSWLNAIRTGGSRVARSAEPSTSSDAVSRWVKNSKLNGSPSSLPSSAWVPLGTVATNRVATGRSALGHTTSVLSSVHFASPGSSGDRAIGGDATGLSSWSRATIGRENAIVRWIWPVTWPVGLPVTLRSTGALREPPQPILNSAMTTRP